MSWIRKSEYQGWKNYPTWAIALWMDNDRASYDQARGMARAALEAKSEREAQLRLADHLKGWWTDQEPDLGANVWSDLLTSALDEVNWDEIAKNLIEEVKESMTWEAV